MVDAEAFAPWAERPKYVQRFTDANGRERIYFRYKDRPQIALTSPWGSQAMFDEASACLARIRQVPALRIGTVCAALAAYRKSADFASLAPATQKEYDRWLDRFELAFAGVLLQDIDSGFVLELRDKWAERGYRAANVALQILKNVCKTPRLRGEIAGDPFADIDKVKRPQALGEANLAWTDGEIEAAIGLAIERKHPGLARALALGRWGGFRRQTICRLPRSARIERANDDGVLERRILWTTEKRLVLCDRREDARLTALLDRTKPSGKITALTVAYNRSGERWTPYALNHALARLVAALAKQGLCREGLGLHGLRHARGVELAMAGASDAEIMSQLDHSTPRAAAIYRRQAERLKLADSAQSRVDAEVIRLRTRCEARRQSGEG